MLIRFHILKEIVFLHLLLSQGKMAANTPTALDKEQVGTSLIFSESFYGFDRIRRNIDA